MHKRNGKKLLERKINNIILHGSVYDRNSGETVSTMTRVEVLDQLKERLKFILCLTSRRAKCCLTLKGLEACNKIKDGKVNFDVEKK